MWDELLLDFAPKWLKKIFPVHYTRDIRHRTVNNFKVCPHIDVPNDKMKHVKFLIG